MCGEIFTCKHFAVSWLHQSAFIAARKVWRCRVKKHNVAELVYCTAQYVLSMHKYATVHITWNCSFQQLTSIEQQQASNIVMIKQAKKKVHHSWCKHSQEHKEQLRLQVHFVQVLRTLLNILCKCVSVLLEVVLAQHFTTVIRHAWLAFTSVYVNVVNVKNNKQALVH